MGEYTGIMRATLFFMHFFLLYFTSAVMIEPPL